MFTPTTLIRSDRGGVKSLDELVKRVTYSTIALRIGRWWDQEEVIGGRDIRSYTKRFSNLSLNMQSDVTEIQVGYRWASTSQRSPTSGALRYD